MSSTMSDTASVSKGCFGFGQASLRSSKASKALINPLKKIEKESWHIEFAKAWSKVDKQLEGLETDVTEGLLKDVTEFIRNSDDCQGEIPTAAILAGVNLPDHSSLFDRLRRRLKAEKVAASVATLHSSSCVSLKNTIEFCVAQLMHTENEMEWSDSEEEESETPVKKSDCTISHLSDWYDSLVEDRPLELRWNEEKIIRSKLVVVLQDFEAFPHHILHKFIEVLSSHRSKLPFVLVFGVATTVAALDDALTHKCISRLSCIPFQAQPSVYFLNTTLNKVFLSSSCPFQMSGKLFKFFTQVFLFYDFSVNRFIQGIKYCAMEHFRENRLAPLLWSKTKLDNSVKGLKPQDLQEIRKLESFQKHLNTLDTPEKQKLKNDKFLKEEVLKLMTSLFKYIEEMYAALKLLFSFVADLPQAPLGKQLRELYCVAMSRDISKTDEFRECKQLLCFQAKAELSQKIDEVLKETSMGIFAPQLNSLKKQLLADAPTLEDVDVAKSVDSPHIKNRSQFKQMFDIGAGRRKTGNEKVKEDLIQFLMEEVIATKVKPMMSQPLWEIVTLVETDARFRVVPRIRAPIHTALNNPAHYLMCDCCKVKNEGDIVSTMPDLCIAYKLHLESGSLINMYDWLQSFNVIVNPDSIQVDDISPEVQARFTQAVAELELMGFIQSSKKKTDHVTRLTWGGSA